MPADAFKEFTGRQNFTSSSICEFAGTINIAPGIVIGRLQREGYLKYSMMNEWKEHYVIGV